ncbi:hypothetical protein Ciccas_005980 [Cichlidogyrus casuarinus]|uniref:Uncharacterized protein n=1 Tax=Cichlidogyrus casuarinus TaxID=1844966 RepID=A0ABD2Q754_9PLAT
MTSSTCSREDLVNFLKATEDFGKLQAWALQDDSVPVFREMFPMLYNISWLLRQWKKSPDEIKEAEPFVLNYQNKDNSQTEEDTVKAYSNVMEKILEILIKTNADKKSASDMVCRTIHTLADSYCNSKQDTMRNFYKDLFSDKGYRTADDRKYLLNGHLPILTKSK